ncbi:B-box zinc finger protein [Actomonas aquatica]|uniref:B-box zinc finger protein n=1 Tax=Actomonas aquatica TaxID=2866162 RepID=A0ABZ1C5H1_9BACT|nr:B-box zinc finger protein [Opitutus sp. WL0086]WRQ86598.1 B-box zinc finger protein [Opitutus sp. WL0086]
MNVPPLPKTDGAEPASPTRAAPVQKRRCMRHAQREAVAKCLGCGGALCRECVSTHGGKIYCAPCRGKLLAAEAEAGKPRRRFGPVVRRWVLSGLAFLLAWTVFLLIGRFAVSIPPTTHDATLWDHWQEGGP